MSSNASGIKSKYCCLSKFIRSIERLFMNATISTELTHKLSDCDFENHKVFTLYYFRMLLMPAGNGKVVLVSGHAITAQREI